MVAKTFEAGDLVWARMKGYPDWPGKIDDSPGGADKKGKHYVYFFGSKNSAWIPADKIKYHSEEMFKSLPKKKYAFFEEAIAEIKSESKKFKGTVKTSNYEKETKSVNETSKGTDNGLHSMTKKTPPKKQKEKVVPVKLPSREEKTESSSSAKSVVKNSKKRKLSGTENSSSSSPKKPKDDYTTLFESVLPSMGVTDGMGNVENTTNDKDHNKDLNAAPEPKPSSPIPTEIEAQPIEPETEKPPKLKTIGFVGLGMLGQGIIKNLLHAGHRLVIWNRTSSKCDPFVSMGAIKASSPADVVKKSDITLSCLSDPHAVRTVMFGENGVLKGYEGCSLQSKGYVEMSSIDGDTSMELAEAVQKAGMRYLEAPVVGSKKRAEDGTILILASGDRDLFHECESCFHAMSNHAYYLSCNVGRSSDINIITSMFVGVCYAALAEALALTERAKLSRADLLEILELRGVLTPLLVEKGKAILENNYSPDNLLKHQQKDLHLALALSDQCDQPLAIARAANDLYKQAKKLGCSDQDAAAVYHSAWI